MADHTPAWKKNMDKLPIDLNTVAIGNKYMMNGPGLTGIEVTVVSINSIKVKSEDNVQYTIESNQKSEQLYEIIKGGRITRRNRKSKKHRRKRRARTGRRI
jgi:hypothetical protein